MFNIKFNIIAAGAAFILSFLLGLISSAPMPLVFIRPVIFAVVFFVLFAMIQIIANRFLPELLEGRGKEEKNGLFPGSRIDIREGEPMATARDYSTDVNPTDSISTDANTEFATETVLANRPVQPSVGARPNDSEKEMDDISDLGKTRQAGSKEPLADQGLLADQEPLAEDQGPLADQQLLADIDQNLKSDYTDTGEVEDVSMFEQKEQVRSETASLPQPEEKQAPSGAEMPDFFLTNTLGITTSDEVLPDLDSMAGAFASSSAFEESETNDYSVPSPERKPSSSKGGEQTWAGDFVPKDIASGLRTVLIKDKEA